MEQFGKVKLHRNAIEIIQLWCENFKGR
jgi:hypothetical protein